MFAQRLSVASFPFLADEQAGRAAQVRDATVAVHDQMLDCGKRSPKIVGHDLVRSQALDHPIEINHGNIPFLKSAEVVVDVGFVAHRY